MSVIKIYTPAKINLTLQVFHKRSDGFHELETVMQAVDLWDTIKIRAQGAWRRGQKDRKENQGIGENEIVVKCSPKKFHVPEDENNLCYKAAALFLTEAGINNCDVHISIRKTIPPETGLGGGSGNAAGCLAALNALFSLPLSFTQLTKLARKLGSDVPYFLHGGLALCRGRGEKIIPLRAHSGFCVLLVFPDFTLSTKDVYRHLFLSHKDKRVMKETGNSIRYCKSLIDSMQKKSIIHTGTALRNDLEKSRLPSMKKIAFIKNVLIQKSACGAAMSGSGSCVYGIFKTEEKAMEARRHIARTLAGYSARVVRAVPGGVRKG